jgi:hypothetical protein
MDSAVPAMTPIRVTVSCSDTVSAGLYGPMGMTTYATRGNSDGDYSP